MFTLLYYYLFEYYSSRYEIKINIEQDNQTEYQIFYSSEQGNSEFSEDYSYKYVSDKNNVLHEISTYIVMGNITKIRVDFGYLNNSIFKLESIVLENVFGNKSYSAHDIVNGGEHIIYNNVEILDEQNGLLSFTTTGIDPYIIIKDINIKNTNYLILSLSIIIALISTFVFYKFVKLKVIYNLFKDFFTNRKLIISLAANDFKTKYAGSYFGIIWAFVQPLCTILMFWFVFQIGFKSKPVEDVPFVLWLACGLIPWFFFSDAWGSATNSFIDYSYLVKKVVFKINILPIVKVLSSLVVHIVFVMFLFLMFFIYRIYPTIYMLQIIYYIFCMCVLIIGLSLITSTLIIFFKDLGQLMNIILQFGMWLTPIMWNTDVIPLNFVWVFKLNPMYYIVQGFRDSMLTNIMFYQNVRQTLYFWCITLIILLVGSLLFAKLKSHFADVL
ncbi:ABC transporter permease [Anaerocolumna cellulosilytica]|nr:ABC transporter permease [Anaerocolumna cellulosilytica]MBB5194434.1 teichoic acid transport system permease protein [Anaerocolumna cellulosilytica]